MSACRVGLGCVLALLGAVTGCDSGPSGPGELLVTVDATEALGAVTLEVLGPGILGFEGDGDTHAFSATASAPQNRHRVVLVGPSDDPLRVRIQVDDEDRDVPTVRVVSAAGADNRERSTLDIAVRLGGS